MSNTPSTECGSRNDLEYSFFWSGKPEEERREVGVGFAIKKDSVTKLTEMPRPVSDDETTFEQEHLYYNYQRECSNNDKSK